MAKIIENTTHDSMSIRVIFSSNSQFTFRIGRSKDSLTGTKEILESHGQTLMTWLDFRPKETNQERIGRLKSVAEQSETFTDFMQTITDPFPSIEQKRSSTVGKWTIDETNDGILIDIKFQSKATLKILLHDTEAVSGNASIVKTSKQSLLSAIARRGDETNQDRVLRIENVLRNETVTDSVLFLNELSK